VNAPARIEPLREGHDRTRFDCGIGELDDYIRRRARQDRDRFVAAVFVLVIGDDEVIVGFYTLSSLSILLEDLPLALAKKLPRYPDVPATLIGRLAVDARFRGKGHGESLLMDALRRVLDLSAEVASAAVVVDAKTDEARAFYERYGFIPFTEHARRLFLPMKTIARMFA
jgi:GNAT superfamily N-acetyltransferase